MLSLRALSTRISNPLSTLVPKSTGSLGVGGKDDHLARDCPRPMTCVRCGEEGHTSRECSAPRKERLPRHESTRPRNDTWPHGGGMHGARPHPYLPPLRRGGPHIEGLSAAANLVRPSSARLLDATCSRADEHHSFNCGSPGHLASDCSEPRKTRDAGQGKSFPQGSFQRRDSGQGRGFARESAPRKPRQGGQFGLKD
ncbi:hypothetical protein B0H16DRAFT_1474360 [Mycena metata]|uniref:CCHC-type domain-containing protein n=1 Tax=Mycena metata TaxID=1033252 RepID=A0AAD7HH69_9AGAR|nr:hypothetical protein B0H16DRAFT_1474360 [Mycena metata]